MKKYTRSFFIFFLILIVCLHVFSQENPALEKEVVISYSQRPETLNPLEPKFAIGSNIGTLIFNSLLRFNDQLEPVNNLAESWVISRDGMEYTFNLRRGVLFHDGAELTAEDVVFTYNSIMDPKLRNMSALKYNVVSSFEAESRYVFKVKLKTPYAYCHCYRY